MSAVFKYFDSRKKSVDHPPPSTAKESSPVLTEADEAFLRSIASEDQGPEEPNREIILASDGKAVGVEHAETVPLPASPPVASPGNVSPLDKAVKSPGGTSKTDELKTKGKEYFQYVQSHVPFTKDYERHRTGSHLQDVATAVKTGDSLHKAPDPAKEKSDVANILSKLNLSAINNKAFSFSAESQKLFDRFTLILKDIINGVPTAYTDLENLLTDSDTQLKGMYEKLPPFMQNLIKSLPTKMTATMAPGLAAAMSEKPGADGKLRIPDASQKRSRFKVPALKNLVKGDAVVAMLRSILNFLKLRFPVALTGTNVLLSLAVFLLLFVFWYCYKRGKETRLEKEAAASATKAPGESESGGETDISDNESERAYLEEALRHPHPSQVPLPHASSSETHLK